MSKVLITGADGFIGSHLTELLLAEGYIVRALAQYNSFNNWGWLESVSGNKNLTVVTGDIRDPFFCEKLTEGIDIVYHLAALIAIPYSYISPQSYFETNVNGTLNICTAARKSKVKRILVASTSEVYGTAQYVPIDENHPKQPQSPYSASKIGADAVAMSFFNSFNLPVTIVRPFNTYGPRQSARAIIPTIITQLINGKTQIQLGNTKPTRDFVYVKDTIGGFYEISKCEMLIGKEVNIATQSEISIGDLALEIIHQLNPRAFIIPDEARNRPESSEVYRLCGSNGLITKSTHWEQKISLREGLKETIKWFLDPENFERYKACIFNL